MSDTDRENQKFPKSVGAHPRLLSRWLMQLQDWVDGPLLRHFVSSCERISSGDEIVYVPRGVYERMRRESEAYFAMRKEIRIMADNLLIEWGSKK